MVKFFSFIKSALLACIFVGLIYVGFAGPVVVAGSILAAALLVVLFFVVRSFRK